MPNVVRFTLPAARSLYVRGAGQFVAGVLDVDANDLDLVSRTRYLVRPYGVVEVGIVDSAAPKPSLPAVPAAPSPDPYPQYPTMDEILASPDLRAAFVPFWTPGEAVGAGDVRMTALGLTIKRNTAGTTRGSYDATEAALWTVMSGDGGSPSNPGPTVVVSGLSASTSAAAVNAALIQAAIDTAASASGGTVQVPVGTWTTAPFTLRANVTLAGMGWSTVLRLADGANAHFVTLFDANTEHVGITDLMLDCNGANQTSGNGVHLSNSGFTNNRTWPSSGDPNHYMRRVMIRDAKGHGLYTAGTWSQSHFDGVFAYSSGLNNFRVESPDNFFYNCTSAKAGSEGFYIASNSNHGFNLKSWLSGAVDATNGQGYVISGVDRIDLIGCEAQDNRKHGLSLVTTDQSNVIGFRANRNGLGADGTGGVGDGIYAENVTNSRIDAVADDHNNGGRKQRWGYNLGGGNNGNIVTLVIGDHQDNSVPGIGSWGAGSSVTVTWRGQLAQGHVSLADAVALPAATAGQFAAFDAAGDLIAVPAPSGGGSSALDSASVQIVDDFLSGSAGVSAQIGALGWNRGAIASANGTTSAIAGELDHPGIIRLDSGTVAAGLMSLHLSPGPTVLSDNYSDLTWFVRPNQIDADSRYRIGFVNNSSGDPSANGAYFERLYGEANWFAVTRNGSTQTRTDTGVAATVAWVKMRIRRISATSFGFTINAGTELVVTATLPSVASAWNPAAQVGTQTTTAKTLDIDRFQAVITGLTR